MPLVELQTGWTVTSFKLQSLRYELNTVMIVVPRVGNCDGNGNKCPWWRGKCDIVQTPIALSHSILNECNWETFESPPTPLRDELNTIIIVLP